MTSSFDPRYEALRELRRKSFKIQEIQDDTTKPPEVFTLFQVSLENYIPTKWEVAKIMKQPLSEIENLEFWEFEMGIEWIEKKNKAENKRHEEEQGKHSLENNMPKMPKVKMPTYPTSFPKLR